MVTLILWERNRASYRIILQPKKCRTENSNCNRAAANQQNICNRIAVIAKTQENNLLEVLTFCTIQIEYFHRFEIWSLPLWSISTFRKIWAFLKIVNFDKMRISRDISYARAIYLTNSVYDFTLLIVT